MEKLATIKQLLFFLFLFSFINGTVAQNCDNIGFESGNTNKWICGSGLYGTLDPGKCSPSSFPNTLSYNGNCLNQGGDNSTDIPADATHNRHTIFSNVTLKDANSLNTVPCVAPASLFPSGVNHCSVRLGNARGNETGGVTPALSYSEGIKYTLTVTRDNAGLTFMYAVFLHESANPSPLHVGLESAQFEVKITNSQNQLIDCGYYRISETSPGLLTGSSSIAGTWRYSNWKKVGLDLTAYIGQAINIEFITTDCFPKLNVTTNGSGDSTCTFTAGMHSSYAYIDLYCSPVQIIPPAVCANQSTIQLCAPDGFSSYEWAPAPGLQPPFNVKCVTVAKPRAGDKYHVTMKSLMGSCPYKTTIMLPGYGLKVSDTSVCEGGSAQLKISTVNTGNYEFKWEPSTYLDKSDVINPVFTAGGTTTYTVTMIDKDFLGNCNDIKNLQVTVKEKAIVEASDLTIFKGETATLNGKITKGNGGVWVGGAGTFTPDRYTLNAIYKPTADEENKESVQLTLQVTDSSAVCPVQSKEIIITILNPTGIQDADKATVHVEIYPIPLTNESVMHISGLFNFENVELKMYDALGKQVSTQKCSSSTKLNKGDLRPGMYFIEICDHGKVVARRDVIVGG